MRPIFKDETNLFHFGVFHFEFLDEVTHLTLYFLPFNIRVTWYSILGLFCHFLNIYKTVKIIKPSHTKISQIKSLYSSVKHLYY